MTTPSGKNDPGAIGRRLDQIAEVMERVVRATMRLVRDAEPECGLTPHQFMLMRAIEASGATSIGALRHTMRGAQSTMSEMVARLARAGYVRKRADPHDKRAVVVELTARGRDALEARRRDLRERHRVVLAALSGEDQEKFLAALETLAALIERAANANPDAGEGGGDDDDE